MKRMQSFIAAAAFAVAMLGVYVTHARHAAITYFRDAGNGGDPCDIRVTPQCELGVDQQCNQTSLGTFLVWKIDDANQAGCVEHTRP